MRRKPMSQGQGGYNNQQRKQRYQGGGSGGDYRQQGNNNSGSHPATAYWLKIISSTPTIATA